MYQKLKVVFVNIDDFNVFVFFQVFVEFGDEYVYIMCCEVIVFFLNFSQGF